MGANYSITITKINQEIYSRLSNDCNIGQECKNVVKGTKIHVKDCNCKYCGVAQKISLKAACKAENMVTAIIGTVNSLKEEQKTSLFPGVNFSLTETEINQQIRNIIENRCQTQQDAENVLENDEIIIDACGKDNPELCDYCGSLQMCDLTAQCYYTNFLNMVQDANNTIEKKQTQTNIIAALIAVGVVMALAGGGYYLYKKQQEKKKGGTKLPSVKRTSPIKER